MEVCVKFEQKLVNFHHWYIFKWRTFHIFCSARHITINTLWIYKAYIFHYCEDLVFFRLSEFFLSDMPFLSYIVSLRILFLVFSVRLFICIKSQVLIINSMFTVWFLELSWGFKLQFPRAVSLMIFLVMDLTFQS